jgi:hypothetical protein
MVQSRINIYIYYDLHVSPIVAVPLDGTLPTLNLLVDPEKGYLYCLETTSVTTYGVDIVDDNKTLAAPGGLAVTNSSSNSTSNSSSNSTTNGTNSTNNVSINGTNSSVNRSTEALQNPAES